MSAPDLPAPYEPPRSMGADPHAPADGIPAGPAQPATPRAATAPAPPASPPPVPRPVRVATATLLAGVLGLAAATVGVVDVADGREVSWLFLVWVAVGLLVVLRLALVWQHRLNDTPLSPRPPGQ